MGYTSLEGFISEGFPKLSSNIKEREREVKRRGALDMHIVSETFAV